MRRAFILAMRKIAREVWNYDSETAALIADRSVREKDHYYRLFEAGWKAHKESK